MPMYHRPISRRRVHKMNARLRKKFHLAEFQSFVFVIKGELVNESSYQTPKYFEKFLDEWIDLVEGLNLLTGGGGANGQFSFVLDCQRMSYQIAALKREMLIQALLNRHDIAALYSGNLIDGVYSDMNMFDSFPNQHRTFQVA